MVIGHLSLVIRRLSLVDSFLQKAFLMDQGFVRCHWVGRLLPLLFCVSLVVGCGDTRRQSVEGTVTFDGEPLDRAAITFFPLAGTLGPAAGANIEEGKFRVKRDKGTFAGTFRVEIAKYDVIPGQFMAGKDGPIPVQGNILPVRYSTENSELTAEIKAGEKNVLQFDLTSK